MENVFVMKVGYVVGDVHLDVVGQCCLGVFQEFSEALFHQLHQKDGWAHVYRDPVQPPGTAHALYRCGVSLSECGTPDQKVLQKDDCCRVVWLEKDTVCRI